MANLIETLIQGGVRRQDEKLLAVTARSTPTRVRELLEVFGALGKTASFQSLNRSLDLRDTDPRRLTNAVLGRWPTLEEIAALPEPYTPWPHVSALVRSAEFRGKLVRRTLEAFPEKQRFLHVRIPSCAGQHIETTMDTAFPLIPVDTGARRFADPALLAPTLGRLFAMMSTARVVALSLPRLSPFIDLAVAPDDAMDFHWDGASPPARAMDRLFAVVRSPLDLALSQVNGTLTALKAGKSTPALAQLAKDLGAPPPAAATAAWVSLGRRLLAEKLPYNPMCNALGDGTAAGAMAACSRCPIELVDLASYREWSRTAFGHVTEAINVSEQFLKPEDLTAREQAIIKDHMAEDSQFHALVAKRQSATGLPVVWGADL